MKTRLASLLACILLLGGVARAEAPNRAALGVVGEDVVQNAARPSVLESGVRVQSLQPGGAAENAGLEEGDVIVTLDGKPVHNKVQLAALLSAYAPMDTVRVEFMRAGHLQAATVRLMRVPNPAASVQRRLDTAVGGDRVPRPLVVQPEVRQKLRELRAEVCRQLAQLPDGTDTAKLTDTLQAIRDLACETNAQNGRGETKTRAGEAILTITDAAGSVIIRGANNLITVEIFDANGKALYHAGIDTPEQRAAIPQQFLQRLKELH